MAPNPESETGSGLRKRNGTSISELISELRDSFLTSDFDRVEKVLLAREERLEAELDEKEREIGSLREKLAIERLGRINAELELEKLRQKKVVRSDNGFGLDCEIVVKREKCNVDGGGEVEGGKVGALGKKERRVAALESEKERNVCEQKKEVVGISGSLSLKTNEGGLGASDDKKTKYQLKRFFMSNEPLRRDYLDGSNAMVTKRRSEETIVEEAMDEQERETIKIQDSSIKALGKGKRATSML